MKKLFVSMIFVFMFLVIVFTIAYAKNDTCVIHKGKELWVNYHALKDHLGHGDKLCKNQDPKDDPKNDPVSTEIPKLNNSGENDIVKVLTANYKDEVLYLTWLGIPESARICSGHRGKNCNPNYEPPIRQGLNSNGYYGYMTNLNLEKGVYFIDLIGRGNRTESVKFIIP